MTPFKCSFSVQWTQCLSVQSETVYSHPSVSVILFVRDAVFLFFPATGLTGKFQITWPRLLHRLVSLKLQVGGEELGILRVGHGKGLKFT